MEETGNTAEASGAFEFLREIAAELSTGKLVFPTFVDVAFRLRQLSSDPDLSIERIANMVGAEPLLAACTIKLANSAAYNPGGHTMTDLHKAVILIGLDAVRSLMYSLAMQQLQRSKEMARYHEVAHRLWDHTVETAAMAHVIAKKCSRIDSEKALFTGLVHDLGAFYLLYRLAISGREFPDSEAMPLVVEWHAEIGYAVLTSLDLPEEIAEAIKFHDVERTEIRHVWQLSDVVYLANLFAGGDRSWFADEGATMPPKTQPVIEIPDCPLPDILAESRAEIDSLKTALA
jgi:HD-like signal output (HDOD) protein